jgi:hypothetical protein
MRPLWLNVPAGTLPVAKSKKRNLMGGTVRSYSQNQLNHEGKCWCIRPTPTNRGQNRKAPRSSSTELPP